MATKWCTILLVVNMLVAGHARTVLDLITENPDLSEFLSVIRSDSLTLEIMRQDEGTVFAPNNDAMAKFTGDRNYQLLKYHMVNLALSLDQLRSERTVLTRLKGNQPLFVASLQNGDTFVNNARIVSGDHGAESERSPQNQVLHIIDEVLQPTIPNQRSSNFFNPTALDLMVNSDKYSLEGTAIGKFYQKVQEHTKMEVFNSRGNHTYFIPIDNYFDAVQSQINAQVLDGHVIPNHVLFTRTMGEDTYRTLGFSDMLKVTIRLRSEQLPGQQGEEFPRMDPDSSESQAQRTGRLYDVQSTTLLGDIMRPAGSVLSRLVRPNIAVRNGVVHLIQKPLMVMDGNVLQFIQEGASDRFQRFYKLLQVHASDFIEKLMTASFVTLFIPSNQAFEDVDQARLSEIEKSPEKLKSLLSLHLVNQMVSTRSVRDAPQRQGVFSVDSDAPGRPLYLSVWNKDGLHPTLTVAGGGTNATVVVPDIKPDNGIVHIIDRILGVPYDSVRERLAEDPLLSSTNQLSAQSGFSADLNSGEEPVTLLVPSNTAWERIKVQLSDAYNTISSGKAPDQVKAVLQRHMIRGHQYTIAELARLSAEHGGVDMVEGKVQFEHIPGSTDYLVKWENVQARVSRADEECTNGYIHVIDAVLMADGDVRTSGAAVTAAAGPAAALLAACLALRL